MAKQAPLPVSGVNIPEETRKKFPQLIELIVASESMNNEERQYWINILPIMTADQIANLASILENEKKQLAAIDKKYADQMTDIGKQQSIKTMEKDRHTQRTKRSEQEKHAMREEEETAESILQQINDL